MQSGAALGKKVVNKNCSTLFSSDVLLHSNIFTENRFHVAPVMCLYATKMNYSYSAEGYSCS